MIEMCIRFLILVFLLNCYVIFLCCVCSILCQYLSCIYLSWLYLTWFDLTWLKSSLLIASHLTYLIQIYRHFFPLKLPLLILFSFSFPFVYFYRTFVMISFYFIIEFKDTTTLPNAWRHCSRRLQNKW